MGLTEKMAYGTSAATTICGLTVNEAVALAGLLLAIGTFAVNWIYKHLNYRLAVKRAKTESSHEE